MAESDSSAPNKLPFGGTSTPGHWSTLPDARESLTSRGGGGTCPLRLFWKLLPLGIPPPSPVLLETFLGLAPQRPQEGPHQRQIHSVPVRKAAAVSYFEEPLFWAELCPPLPNSYLEVLTPGPQNVTVGKIGPLKR